YVLHIEFAEGSSKLMAQYYEHLDVIGTILKDSPGVTVRIEGHCEQLASSSERQAKSLTQKRAEAIRDYLSGDKWNIAKKRMEAVGCGFSMPIEKPDLINGNPANRRIEIYINRPAASARQGTVTPADK
ncbi:MAG: OmpA family protein, partial [bacterium]